MTAPSPFPLFVEDTLAPGAERPRFDQLYTVRNSQGHILVKAEDAPWESDAGTVVKAFVEKLARAGVVTVSPYVKPVRRRKTTV